MKIHKYELPVAPRPYPVLLPAGAELLHVGEETGRVYVWALVDPDTPQLEQVEFCTVGTGGDWPTGFRYLNTVQPSYARVWHIGARK